MFPILVIFTLTLAIVECAGRRRDEESSNCAGAVCASGGCGRRELEDRRFPTVLTAETGKYKSAGGRTSGAGQ